MALLLVQLVLSGSDAPCSVVQTPDQSSLDMRWVVGLEVKVPVCVGGLPVDSDIQATIVSPLEQGVKKREASVSLYFHAEPRTLLRWLRSPSTVPFFTIQQVSSTYLFKSWGLEGADSSASSSKNSMYRFVTTAETGEPIAAPSRCS